jgi:hypothetical protein
MALSTIIKHSRITSKREPATRQFLNPLPVTSMDSFKRKITKRFGNNKKPYDPLDTFDHVPSGRLQNDSIDSAVYRKSTALSPIASQTMTLHKRAKASSSELRLPTNLATWISHNIPVPFPRWGHTAIAAVGKERDLYLFGGLGNDNTPKKDFLKIDTGKGFILTHTDKQRICEQLCWQQQASCHFRDVWRPLP